MISGSREFAHIHPDGSLHVWAPVDLALEVHEAKWGEIHPWVDQEGFWDGVVMVFTPETFEELEITIESALEWLADDELLEVTPANLRLRKRRLSGSLRKR